ncbi:MAG: hypothetical protein JJE04_18855 [Acidobacteriia bacterium]|nr:hypothetical protein [Terriglobia bacterium]
MLAPIFPAWRWRPGWLGWLLLVSAGAAAGIGIESMVYFLLLWAGLASAGMLWGSSMVLLAATAGLAWRFRASGEAVEVPARKGSSQPSNRHLWWMGLAAACGLLMAAISVASTTTGAPHGDWDAWSMWNLRAKHLAGPDMSWRHAVSVDMPRSWPDYPLLVPASVARLWRMGGAITTTAPQALSSLYTACAVGLLFGLLAMARGWSAAVLALLPMAASSSYWAQGSAQYADVPLSVYMAGSLGLAMLRQDRAGLMAAGLLASMAAWTKNEGAVYCALLLAAMFYFRGKERFTAMLMGAAPGLIVVAAFKLVLAPAPGLLADPISSIPGKLASGDRWMTIASMAVDEVRNMGLGVGHPLLVLAALGVALGFRPGFKKDVSWRFPAAVLTLQMCAYLGVYLITPSNVQWQVGSSFGRLLGQVWPASLMTVFLAMRTIEEQLPVAELAAPPVKEEKKKKGRRG